MNRNRNKNGTFAKEDYSKEIGKIYGKLQILEIYVNDRNDARCICRCECGNTSETYLNALKRGATKSCGCSMKNELYNNLIGKRFGKLVVIEELERSNRGQARYKCKCDCGNEIEVLGSNLLYDQTYSCGCFRKISWYSDKISIANKSGVRGVHYHNSTKRWVAKLTVKGKVYKKEFKEFDDAVKYRKQLEDKYHKEFKDEYNKLKKQYNDKKRELI